MAIDVHICLIASEFLGVGVAGGFGFATRSLGRNLVASGHQVTAVIPQPRDSAAESLLVDGIRIQTFPRDKLLDSGRLYQSVDADIYHSQEPSLSSFLAQRAVPEAAHVVTARDPRMLRDWWIEFNLPSHSRLGLLRTMAFYENPWTRRAVRRASKVFVPARYLAEVVKSKYGLQQEPTFMPTPIERPGTPIDKATRPTLCYVGRLDRRKRPELFLALAEHYPDVDFIVVGSGQDPVYERQLVTRYGALRNVRMTGFVDQYSSDELSRVLASSWIMVNTAAREGLPNVFIEAAFHGCAIVSQHDPDGFASQFGCHCTDGNFHAAIDYLLEKERWRERGAAGAVYAETTNEAALATDRHLEQYHSLLGSTGT